MAKRKVNVPALPKGITIYRDTEWQEWVREHAAGVVD